MPKKFERVLLKKEGPLFAAVNECIGRLAENPRHPGLQVHRVHGTKGVWEAYVDKANRITFHVDKMDDGERVIVLRNNCNHDIIDRSP